MKKQTQTKYKRARDYRPLFVFGVLLALTARWMNSEGWYSASREPATAEKILGIVMVSAFLLVPITAGIVALWDDFTNAEHKIPNRDRNSYEEYIRSPEWKEVADYIRKRAGYRCEHCGAAGRLDVHHLTYKNLFEEETADLVALCRTCHEQEHGIQ